RPRLRHAVRRVHGRVHADFAAGRLAGGPVQPPGLAGVGRGAMEPGDGGDGLLAWVRADVLLAGLAGRGRGELRRDRAGLARGPVRAEAPGTGDGPLLPGPA